MMTEEDQLERWELREECDLLKGKLALAHSRISQLEARLSGSKQGVVGSVTPERRAEKNLRAELEREKAISRAAILRNEVLARELRALR